MSRCKTFRSQLFQSDFSLITLSLTLKMTTAQIVETSVNLTTVLLFGTHSPGRSYSTHLWPNSWLKLFSLTPLYGHLIITDSLLCPWENKTLIYIFSKFNPLNTDTPLIQTLTIPPSPQVSVFRGFDCTLKHKTAHCAPVIIETFGEKVAGNWRKRYASFQVDCSRLYAVFFATTTLFPRSRASYFCLARFIFVTPL